MHNASRQLGQLITGYWLSQAIYVAAKLEIADLLAQGPRTAADLAKATSTHERSLYRMLRALASVGVFSEVTPRTFAINGVADPLRRDAPGSQWAMAVMMGEEHFKAWGELLYSVQTGRTSFDKVFGQPVFDYLGSHPEQGAIFDQAMVSIHGIEAQQMLDAYDFAGVKTLVDIGGGNGSLLQGVLRKHEGIQAVLFDLPTVIERARSNWPADLAGRVRFETGNFFEAVVAGGDAYQMRHIIHDWNDEQCHAILTNIHRAMPAQAKLLIIETVIPPGNEPCFGKLLDLTMLTIPGGLERTADEYHELLGRAGFRITRIVPTAGEVSVIEAVKI